MNRRLTVDIDHATWPHPPGLPSFPGTFHRGAQTFDFDVLMMLLAIGFLTTPAHATGVSLSEFWAWVRYLHAVSGDPDLRITADFANLDAHQKTILSDDFGMGAPMCWLAPRLHLGAVCDGRYFLDRIAPALGIGSLTTAKRGPQKSPDFVARDVYGVWHVIECKGTQSGAA